jgi:hypothetical protein
LGGEGYGNMGPLGLGNRAFNRYMFYFSVVVSTLSLGVKVGIEISDDGNDCAMSWEGFILLLGILGLKRRWWWISFIFDMGLLICTG